MPAKVYKLFCESCGWFMISDGTDLDKLYEIKTSSIQTTLPQLNSENKTIPAKFKQPTKKFRCPSCGFVVKPRKVDNPQDAIDQKNQEEERAKKRLEDEEKFKIEEEERQKINEQNRINRNKKSNSGRWEI